ncbi:MAG: PilT/PilU family type 4a pilus ATPase [Capsulimonadaceae bacterium]|nr:PilT/PilU family type 4a pilus ATPase [Capsulimonadaceae bacterium]
MLELFDMIRDAAKRKASDVFIKKDCCPCIRQHGSIVRMDDYPVLTADDTRNLAYSVMTHEQIGRFEHRHELDIAQEIEGLTRLRINIYQQRGAMAMTCRLVPLKIYTLEQLGMPPVLADITKSRQGLVLVTGPTGSGKSTTLSAMINNINETRNVNIITVEDPIEFVHPDKMAIVSQREVGFDTDSFSDALKYMMRQNPDVLLVGELRDIETMSVALTAAETGHLVFSTLHTSSAPETLDRIVNMYPPTDRDMLNMRLANSLKGVVSQKLLPRADGTGRVGAIEVMITTPTIQKIIEDGKVGNLYAAISEGNFWGMQTMNQCLLKYVKAGIVTEEEALHNAGNITELKQAIRRPG